jgi:hypothetical protein
MLQKEEIKEDTKMQKTPPRLLNPSIKEKRLFLTFHVVP